MKKMVECPECRSGQIETDGSFFTKPCDSCGYAGRRPRGYRYTGRTTEFRNAQTQANLMRDNGASDWQIEQATGIAHPYKRSGARQ